MQISTLPNGMTVIYHHRRTESIAVQLMVNAGSNNEDGQTRGISHFIEHMLFEGTKKRKSSMIIANEVEKYGAELNAYTTDSRTCYYVKIIQKHFDTALDILADMAQYPLFRKRDIERERKIILDEIGMITDQPRQYQWIVFAEALFERHPFRYPVHGSKETVAAMSRQQMLEYYHRYYVPSNMVIVVVGEMENAQERIAESFGNFSGKPCTHTLFTEPDQKQKQKTETRDIGSSYVVLGFKTVPRLHPDSYALDVCRGILGRGQSGKIFYELRTRRGLGYDAGILHECGRDYGFFAVHATTNKKNIPEVKRVMQQVIALKGITAKDIQEAKDFIEGTHLLQCEDTAKLADVLGYWQHIGDAGHHEQYISKIQNVSLEDVRRAARKYFTDKYTFIAIKQK